MNNTFDQCMETAPDARGSPRQKKRPAPSYLKQQTPPPKRRVLASIDGGRSYETSRMTGASAKMVYFSPTVQTPMSEPEIRPFQAYRDRIMDIEAQVKETRPVLSDDPFAFKDDSSSDTLVRSIEEPVPQVSHAPLGKFPWDGHKAIKKKYGKKPGSFQSRAFRG